ncbi:MAG: metallophosphoesterase [Erysipelotrichales bacterium]|nr:metallophosphoesterase [Erysipelotrichales bacterium]
MKKWLLAFLAGGIMFFCSCKAPVKDGKPVRIFFLTDPHYLAESLYDEGEASDAVRNLRDGKETVYTKVILEALIDTALEEKPDAVIIGGDNSYNGEEASHKEFAALFEPLIKEGIKVLTVPGNHDIRNSFAYDFTGEKVKRASTIEAQEFAEIYADLGFKDAYSKDKNSLSFMTKLTEEVWVLCLDVQKYEYNTSFGPVSDSWIKEDTQKWARKMFEKAKKAGAILVPVVHQSVIPYEGISFEEYSVGNASKIRALMKEFDSPVCFTGHLHVQAIMAKEEDGKMLYDCSTGSLSVPENLFGDITIVPGESISYTVRSADVDSYAKKMGWEDEILRNFHQYTINHFRDSTYTFFLGLFLGQEDIAEEDAYALARLGALINPYFYAGKAEEGTKAMKESPDYETYLRYEDQVLVKQLFNKTHERKISQRALQVSLKGKSE